MFQQRFIRDDDATHILSCYAYLIRHHGLPQRPTVPSPLHKSQGIETLVYAQNDARSIEDWAQDSFATILHAINQAGKADLILRPDGAPQTGQTEAPHSRESPLILGYDPSRVSEPGHFVSRIMLQLAAVHMSGFETAPNLSGVQRALIWLSACAFMRQGFALAHCAPALQTELSVWSVPQRVIESHLVFAACLGLRLRRQAPEQIVATYGRVLSPSMRRKIRPACRQIDHFAPEVKWLQSLSEPIYADLNRPSAIPKLAPQPQRISWT